MLHCPYLRVQTLRYVCLEAGDVLSTWTLANLEMFTQFIYLTFCRFQYSLIMAARVSRNMQLYFLIKQGVYWRSFYSFVIVILHAQGDVAT